MFLCRGFSRAHCRAKDEAGLALEGTSLLTPPPPLQVCVLRAGKPMGFGVRCGFESNPTFYQLCDVLLPRSLLLSAPPQESDKAYLEEISCED